MVSRRSVLRVAPCAATVAAFGAGRPARAADSSAVDASVADAGAAAVRSFSAEFYRALAGTADRRTNLVCSPYSVVMALAMARAGARGRTAAEMDGVLHAPEPAPGALDAGLHALDQLMTAEYQGDGGKRPFLSVADSLWAQLDLSLEPAFRETLTTYYGAEAHRVDFRATETARAAINAWISERTRTRIPELLAPGALDPMTKLVLANAIYLKAGWRAPFDRNGTKPATFTLDDGRTTTVAMMSGLLHEGAYQEGDGFLAVALPYVDAQLAMAVVVPAPGRLAAVEAAVDGAWLTGLFRGFRSSALQLSMPRWRFRLPTDLGALLSKLGMPTAFSGAADFSGITRDLPLRIDKVLHEAFIAVDEKGTEAAAATAIIQQPSLPKPKTVVVDRPFLFVIYDAPRAAPLFVGRVGDPGDGQTG